MLASHVMFKEYAYETKSTGVCFVVIDTSAMHSGLCSFYSLSVEVHKKELLNMG